MKLKLLSAVIAASLLAGCSSSGSSGGNSGGQVGAPTTPDLSDPDFDSGVIPTYANINELGGAVIITGDNGNNAIIRTDGEGNAAVAINDYNNMYVVKDGELFDNDGNQVGNISNDDGQYTVSLDNGLEVVLRDEDGRLFAAIISKPNPDQPIIHDPDYDGGITPTYGNITELGGAVIVTGDNGNNAIIRTDGEGNAAIAINDYDNMYVVKDGELFDNDGNQVGNISNDDGQYTVSLDNGLEVVLRDEDGRLFAAIISKPNPDQPIIHDPDYDSGIILLTELSPS
ncbi:hypothetical protein JCM19240_2119 [Vibrio maritimus]|uniref:Lipoprotein n=1 Tax=Vibrio maritimus TaxID=990268 RepID=A0A090T2M8_9VIBR|nr:hypothetical protein JCM19240_2119 [Vibrio maritimus]